MENPTFWYFEKSGVGIIVGNIEWFEIMADGTGVTFHMRSGYKKTITNQTDTENFQRNILILDDEDLRLPECTKKTAEITK